MFCNPQYYNPAFWLEDALLESGPQQAEALLKAGVQKGCRSIPLPSKSTETCPQGTSPVINEFFNLEWCVPDCPNGFFFDLSQSNCVAACYQSGDASSVPIYLDYVDYYATTDRCLPGKDCKANGVPGMCPASNDTKQLNSTEQNGSCPRGMQPGVTSRQENTELCYDVCMPGYEEVSTCPNFAQTCSPNERSYLCRAKCPLPSEGLGPWKSIDSSPVFTCQYNYPGPVPSDPNLWAFFRLWPLRTCLLLSSCAATFAAVRNARDDPRGAARLCARAERVHNVHLLRVEPLLLVQRNGELQNRRLLLLLGAHWLLEQLPELLVGREPVHDVLLVHVEPLLLLLVRRVVELHFLILLVLLLRAHLELVQLLSQRLDGPEPVHLVLLLRVGRLFMVRCNRELRLQQLLLLVLAC